MAVAADAVAVAAAVAVESAGVACVAVVVGVCAAVAVSVPVEGAVAVVGAGFLWFLLALDDPIHVLGARSSASPWFPPPGRTSPRA